MPKKQEEDEERIGKEKKDGEGKNMQEEKQSEQYEWEIDGKDELNNETKKSPLYSVQCTLYMYNSPRGSVTLPCTFD